jgi:hypothetical protein
MSGSVRDCGHRVLGECRGQFEIVGDIGSMSGSGRDYRQKEKSNRIRQGLQVQEKSVRIWQGLRATVEE